MHKNRTKHPKEMNLPVHPALAAVLDMHATTTATYLVTGPTGEQFSLKGLSQRVSAWFREANLPNCSAHSVRKGLATNLAEGEATDSMLDGMFGWSGGATSKIYTAKKKQAILARQAVGKIKWEGLDDIVPHLTGSTPNVCHTTEKNT